MMQDCFWEYTSHYHRFGNWEKIRLDERLGLIKKIAPVELQLGETFLPRAPNLRDCANALLELELAAVTGKNSNSKVGRKASKKDKENVVGISIPRNEDKKGKIGSLKVNAQMSKDRPQKLHSIEPLVKEEGEMSDTEGVYEQFKEVKWMEWCEDVMVGEEKTLKRLQRLQTTSANLPKEKVLAKIRSYLQLLGRRIDQIVAEHEEEPYKQDRMTMRLWNYISNFSNLTGERLNQIYSKLKQEQYEEAGVGPSLINGSGAGHNDRDGDSSHFLPFPRQRGSKNANSYQSSDPVHKGHDTAKFEAWKRRRRAVTDTNSQVQLPYQRPKSNGTRISDPNSFGILGAGPSENRNFGNERPSRTHQTGLPPKQGF